MAGGAEADDTFLRASRGERTVTVSALVREQMLRETMTTECLIDVVEWQLDELDAGSSVNEQRLLFCDEREAWPRPPVLLGERS